MGNKVTVIMGIYNCESTLELSLKSLMSQTYQEFDVVMCDDGSTDNTYNVAMEFCEKHPDRFELLTNNKNMGLNFTLNKCLKHAKGEYIARMDGDDVSLPNRFEKEVEFLDTHTDIAIVSSPMIYFDETGEWGVGTAIETPENKDYIKSTPFAHAPCMVRKEAFQAVSGYTVDKRLLRVEDYHLWIKMCAHGYKGYNIQEPLYKMRDDKNAVGRRNFKGRLNEVYVKYLAFKMLKIPVWYIVFIFRPLLVGLMPNKLYLYLHKARLR
ncbi:glycosyltransferase [Peribacillus frigoritolerans]|uniref:glycosyltransferase n=1 Tax=Peribacillus castrilensis TaxID=2897690 RepID=UPI00296EBCF2|nr:glycosyltransferase [Peribacillus castrilensis]